VCITASKFLLLDGLLWSGISNIYTNFQGMLPWQRNFTFKSQNCTKSSITPVVCIIASKYLPLVWYFCSRGFQFCYQNFEGTLPWQQHFEYQRHNCTKSNITLALCTVASKFVLLGWDYRG